MYDSASGTIKGRQAVNQRGVNKIPPNFDTLRRLYKSFSIKGLIEYDSRSYSYTKQGGRGEGTSRGASNNVCVQKDSTSRVTRLCFILVLSTTNYA